MHELARSYECIEKTTKNQAAWNLETVKTHHALVQVTPLPAFFVERYNEKM